MDYYDSTIIIFNYDTVLRRNIPARSEAKLSYTTFELSKTEKAFNALSGPIP